MADNSKPQNVQENGISVSNNAQYTTDNVTLKTNSRNLKYKVEIYLYTVTDHLTGVKFIKCSKPILYILKWIKLSIVVLIIRYMLNMFPLPQKN